MKKTVRIAPFSCPSCDKGILIDTLDTSDDVWTVHRAVGCTLDLAKVWTTRYEEAYIALARSVIELRDEISRSWVWKLNPVRTFVLSELDLLLERADRVLRRR